MALTVYIYRLQLCRCVSVQYMEITDKDDEKAKAKKKKLQKSWKSQQRFAKLDAETQKRQQSWMDFKKGKGSKKKVTVSLHSLCLCIVLETHISFYLVFRQFLLDSTWFPCLPSRFLPTEPINRWQPANCRAGYTSMTCRVF